MDKNEFESVVRGLTPGQLIEIVQLNLNVPWFHVDDKTGNRQTIRKPCYFDSGTSILYGEPGISVTSSLNHETGRPEPPFFSISHKDIISIDLLYRKE